jgi:hypothetical protein
VDEEGVTAYAVEAFSGGEELSGLVLNAPSAFEPEAFEPEAHGGVDVYLNVVGIGTGGGPRLMDEYDDYAFDWDVDMPVEIIDVPVQVPIADVLRDRMAGIEPEERIADVLRDRAAGVERAPAATTEGGVGGFGALTEAIRSFTGLAGATAGLIRATQGVDRPGTSGGGVRRGVNVAGQITAGASRPFLFFGRPAGTAPSGIMGALGAPLATFGGNRDGTGGFTLTPLNLAIFGGLVYLVARRA